MSDKKIKVIKKSERPLEDLEKDIYSQEVSLFRALGKKLKLKYPEKLKEVVRELIAETV